MKKPYLIVQVVAACVLVVCVVAQPYFEMKALESALATKDKKEIESSVDFQKLKENIGADGQKQVSQLIQGKSETTEADANDFIKEVLDDALNTDGLIKFAHQQKQATLNGEPSYGYEGISRFTGTFHPPKGVPIELVIEREGLHWRLTNIRGFLDHYIMVPDDSADTLDGSQADSSSDEEPIASAQKPSESAMTFEVNKVAADVWNVRSGSFGIHDPIFPASGSKFLYVKLSVRNPNESPMTMPPAGALIADYRGKQYRYSQIEHDDMRDVVVQPLGNGEIIAYYEVPIEVLNEAHFALTEGGLINFEFETPAQKDEKLEAEREAQRQQDEVKKEQEAAEKVVYDKCWALNHKETPIVSREDYGWYDENCSNMFLVQPYDVYVQIHNSLQ